MSACDSKVGSYRNKASATGGDGHTQFGRALFGKLARDSHDAHRPVRPDEDLDSIFARREQRKVTSNLTLHYERKLFLLADTPKNGKHVPRKTVSGTKTQRELNRKDIEKALEVRTYGSN